MRVIKYILSTLFLFASIAPVQSQDIKTQYQVKRFEYKGENCLKLCVSVSFVYPELVSLGTPLARQKIKKQLEKAMLPNERSISSYAKIFVKEYDYLEQGDGLLGHRLPWTSETHVKLETIHSHYVAYSVSHYEYTGGAHGNYWTRYYNFDLKTGEQITLNQLFRAKYLTRLNLVAERAFREAKKIPLRQSLKEAGFNFEHNQFQLNQNFLMLPQGVRFLFDVYEVSYYAAGQSEFEIYYYQMAPFVAQTPYTQDAI